VEATEAEQNRKTEQLQKSLFDGREKWIKDSNTMREQVFVSVAEMTKNIRSLLKTDGTAEEIIAEKNDLKAQIEKEQHQLEAVNTV
jgi:hypothetical protein